MFKTTANQCIWIDWFEVRENFCVDSFTGLLLGLFLQSNVRVLQNCPAKVLFWNNSRIPGNKNDAFPDTHFPKYGHSSLPGRNQWQFLFVWSLRLHRVTHVGSLLRPRETSFGSQFHHSLSVVFRIPRLHPISYGKIQWIPISIMLCTTIHRHQTPLEFTYTFKILSGAFGGSKRRHSVRRMGHAESSHPH